MTKRQKDTAWPTHPWIAELSLFADKLYDYLNINDHTKTTGLYKISPKIMASESKVPIDQLPEALKELEKNVAWYPDLNLIWAKEFLNNQTTKDKDTFLKRVATDLRDIKQPDIVKEFLDYNFERYGIEIQFEKQEGRHLSEAEPELLEAKTALSLEKDTLLIPTPFEMELLEVIKTFPGWQCQENEDLTWLRALTEDFQNVTVANLKACRDYHSDKPTNKGPWKSRIRNWLKKDTDFGKEKQSGTDPDKYIKGKYGHMVRRTRDTTDPSRYKGQKYDHMVKR